MTVAQILEQARQIVGPAHVHADEETCAFMGADIYAAGGAPALVAAPANSEEAARVIAAATRAGFAILPRGGGMSYTGGYVSPQAGGVTLDMRRMDRILAIEPENMVVTVEAGVTWRALHEALAVHGLRTPFWGPLSGIASTIGGGLSQNNAFFGAGTYGPVTDSVVGLKVALADGSLIRTGAGAPDRPPFFRHYGPDLTGLFLGDCGAFGVKTEATLRLVPRPAHETWLSFSFADPAACATALSTIARKGIASELFGFDPNLARVRMKRASMLADAGALLKVVGAQKSLLDGVKEGAKMALAGRGFLDGADYSLHAVVEGRSKAGIGSDAAEIRAIVQEAGGKEVENTIPKVIRANPFTPLNNVLGPEGERWAPVHGIVRHSDAIACWRALDACFAARQATFDAHGVTTGYLVTSLSTNSVLIEPVFFWPDARFAVHDATVEPQHLAKLATRPENPAARAVVAEARQAVVDVFTHFGAAHFQVGRAYPWLATRDADTASLARALKQALDPNHRMNPGVLGLPT